MAQPGGSLHVGCAGWSIPRAETARFGAADSHLQRYSQALAATEINSSFYRPHRPATYARWAEAVPAEFRFAVKLPKQITHELQLRDVAEPLSRFLGEVSHLGEKLGPLLTQLPPKLAFEEPVARGFFEQLRRSCNGPVVCEPRHASWFSAAAEALLAEFRIARVAADPALEPQAGRPGGWPQLVYYRLHGSPDTYYSSYERGYLAALAEQLASERDRGAEVWCIFDNTALGAATANALDLVDLLDQHGD